MANNTQPSAPGPAFPTFRHYLAVGDSLSEGLGDPLSGARLRGWASHLADILRAVAPDMGYTNLAVRGHTTAQAIASQLEAATAIDADLVSVFIGGNDVLFSSRFDAPRFEDELVRLTAPLTGDGVTTVMSTLPDLTACSPLLPPLRGALRRRVEAANDVIRSISAQHGTLLLDSWADPRTRRHGMWSVDRIHPSSRGHLLIARSVAELLGVPTPDLPEDLPRESPVATVARHVREATWLARHAVRA